MCVWVGVGVSVRIRMVDIAVQTDPLPALPALALLPPLAQPPKEEEEVEAVDYRPEPSIAMQAFENRHGRACVPCAKPSEVPADPDHSESESGDDGDNDDGDSSSGGDPSRGAPEANMNFVTFDPRFVDRPWRCAVPDCGKGFKTRAQIKQHGQEKHDIGVVWWPCDYCDVAVKRKTHLISHMAMCHDIYERLWPCAFPGCSFQGKLKNHLTNHIRKTHHPRPARRPVGRPRAPRPVAPPVGPQAAVVDV